MIVRCTNCNSAFAVDDGKVEDKKFAFTCPKCDTENIIDNRIGKKYIPGAPAKFEEARRDSLKTSFVESKKSGDVIAGRKTDVLDEVREARAAGPDSGTGFPATDDLSLDDSIMMNDTSRVRARDMLQDTGISTKQSELPPADDLISDIPLDDTLLVTEHDTLKVDDFDERDVPSGTKKEDLHARNETLTKSVFEEIEDIDEFKSDSELIKDEMEPLSEFKEADTSLDLDLDEEQLLEDEKIIIDEFEHLENESASSISAPDQNGMTGQEIIAEEVFPKDHTHKDDESITIDLNSLNIDLADNEGEVIDKRPPEMPGSDENITIDLDTLDIDLQEEDKVSKGESHDELDLDIADFSEETIKELEEIPRDKDDEDITLDLDSLDISLDESGEIKEGEIIEENEKLTLEDVGLYVDDLTTDEMITVSASVEKAPVEDEISKTFEDIDSSFNIDSIERELKEAETILSETPESRERPITDEFKDLPEINFNDVLQIVESITPGDSMRVGKTEDELLAISDTEKIISHKGGLRKEIPDVVSRGAVNFSIDYSIRYSRLGALTRLLGIFSIGLIPHFISFFIYTVLSIILGFLNHIIILCTAKNVEDFSEIQENTLRYLLSINSSLIGIVEEMPGFAGRDNIDYPLQMRIIYPLRYSRVLAFLRLTVIGILAAVLPHLLILCLVSPFILLIYIIGLFSIFIVARWPHILFEFMTRYYRYAARILSFMTGIIDEYPPFKFN